MDIVKSKAELHRELESFIKGSFKPKFGELKATFKTNHTWAALKHLKTNLWLDTGNIDDSQKLWTQEFSALTTNNTLLNKEIQTGRYDALISQVSDMLNSYSNLTEQQRILEIAFVLNAWHGLRLVEKFDAFVSVEEHTDIANDIDLAVEYARRYRAICPQRFIVKIPFTPAGLLATRKLAAEGITINHTLGFSARQNYVIARIGKPAYVNVFLGRLNSFVVDNKLGDGSYVGEKATLASQRAIRKLRQTAKINTQQIGASFRGGKQVQYLAGIDVMTMPPKVAEEFLALGLDAKEITSKVDAKYQPGINKDVKADEIGLNTLWDIDEKLVACLDKLEKENLDSFTPGDLVSFFKANGCGDVLVKWSESQIATSTKEGKIPKLENWKNLLAEKAIGLDSIMNLAGLNSFIADQKAMDERIKQYSALKK